jgi:hypothetical protein
MPAKFTLYFFIAMSVMALIAFVYVIYDITSISMAIAENHDNIAYDSGTYYLLLISVSWPLWHIEYKGRNKGVEAVASYASKLVIIWFLVTLVLANVIPWLVEHQFEMHQYVACEDPEVITNVGRGESLIYKKHSCD